MNKNEFHKIMIDRNPILSSMGFRISAWEANHCKMELPLKPELMNIHGIPHGGVLATMLDSAMGYSGSYSPIPEEKTPIVTLSLTVNYIAQAKGALLIATANRTGGGRSSYFASSEIVDETGQTICNATGVFRLFPKKPAKG